MQVNQKIGGMTVNERLWYLGLMDDFDACVEKGDREAVWAILRKCSLSDENVERIIDKVFSTE